MNIRKIVFAAISWHFLVFLALGLDTQQTNWTEKWDYRPDELHSIKLQTNSIPLVEVKVNGSPLWVIFDTGCSTGFSLTSAVEGKIAHQVTGKSKERNPDGSYRGETTLATIASLEVFGAKYASVETSFSDWRIFSTLKFNGLLGLRYFKNKRLTIDYQSKIIGISSRPLVYRASEDFPMAVVPLLQASESQADLVYVLGKVKNSPTVIYLDTGSSASFIDPSIWDASETKKDKKHLLAENVEMSIGGFSFTVKRLRVQEQRRGVSFEYPQTVKLGSDVIKDFLITIDKIANRLILQNNWPDSRSAGPARQKHEFLPKPGFERVVQSIYWILYRPAPMRPLFRTKSQSSQMIMDGTDFAIIKVEIRDGKETDHEKALDGRHLGDGDPGFGRRKCCCPVKTIPAA